MKKHTVGMTLAAAAAGLLLAGATTARADSAKMGPNDGEVKCGGLNACKGQSSCMSAANQCKGKNSCKGKGWVSLPEADCEAKGGHVVKS